MRLIYLFAALFIIYGTVDAQTDNVSRKKPAQSAPKNNTTKKSSPRPSATRPASNNGASRTVTPSNGKVAQQKTPQKKSFTVNGISFEMVRVEAGTFTMGATSEMTDPWDREKPAHQVTLTRNYYIGKTEVTQALWKAVMGDNPASSKGDNLPIESANWDSYMQFISKLNSLTGLNFRLPTEAEWEFAARGGNNSKHYQYSGSNNLEEVAWCFSNSNSTTHNVASKKPNELGIYDMSGNVWEYCNDWYGDYSYESTTNPTGPSNGSDRTFRGGCCYRASFRCRSSFRNYGNPESRYTNVGIRLALSE